MTPRRIVVIGAARSGTKIVRDVLAEATGAGLVPYDIGFVWRYGNESTSHDVLDAGSVTPRMQRFISNYVDGYAKGTSPAVIEKTVGNTLRVPFVHALLPDAVFVHLIRDGVDVTESTRRQWTTPPDGKYLAAKLRHFPLRLAPTYGRKYVGSLASRYFSEDARVGSWGPRYPGIDEDIRREDLLTVCARQWRNSVEMAAAGLAKVDAPAVEVRYESLMMQPKQTLERVIAASGLTTDQGGLDRAIGMLSPGRTGASALASEELDVLDREIGATLKRFGYPSALEREEAQ